MSTFNKYVKLLTGSKAMQKNEISSLAWALNGVKRVNLTDLERTMLTTLISSKEERPITREHTKQGIQYLRKLAFRPSTGEPRQGKCQVFGNRELDIIRKFSKFRFVGYIDIQAEYSNSHYSSPYKQLTPVWRVYSRDGKYFDYHVISHGLYADLVLI